jgi:hypothetical protein
MGPFPSVSNMVTKCAKDRGGGGKGVYIIDGFQLFRHDIESTLESVTIFVVGSKPQKVHEFHNRLAMANSFSRISR